MFGVHGLVAIMTAPEKLYTTTYVVETDWDVGLSRRIMDFHKSQRIPPRHGRTTFGGAKDPLIAGACPIWRRLAPSSNNLAALSTNQRRLAPELRRAYSPHDEARG